MLKRFISIVMAGVLVGFLASCSKTADESPEAVLKLTPDEVAALLGIKEKDGIKIGDVESGRDGVKVKTISLKDNGSTEVEIQDVDLRISSTSKFVYAISSLRIGKLDVLDWKTTQRAQAFGILVEKPGAGFLSKLEETIASIRSGGSLKTADLSCARLAIDRIEYVLRSTDATVTTVSIEKLAITDATTEMLGEMSVDRVGFGNNTPGKGRIAGKGLKITKVDRLWADQILALLVTLPTTNQTATTKPVTPIVKSPALGKRLVPFDRFEVAEMSILTSPSLPSAGGTETGSKSGEYVKVTDLHFDVQRSSDGQFAGVQGAVNVNVSTSMFGESVLQFFRAMGNPKLEESVTFSVQLKMVLDQSRNVEQSELTIAAPGLATITGTMRTRQLAEYVSTFLVTQHEPPKDLVVSVSSMAIEGRDDGIVSFLLSDRFKDNADIRKILKELPTVWRDGAERERLASEIHNFLEAPGVIKLSAESSDMMTFDNFFAAIFKDSGKKSSVSLRLSFAGK